MKTVKDVERLTHDEISDMEEMAKLLKKASTRRKDAGSLQATRRGNAYGSNERTPSGGGTLSLFRPPQRLKTKTEVIIKKVVTICNKSNYNKQEVKEG